MRTPPLPTIAEVRCHQPSVLAIRLCRVQDEKVPAEREGDHTQ